MLRHLQVGWNPLYLTTSYYWCNEYWELIFVEPWMICMWLFFTYKKSRHGSWKISKKSRANKVALIRWLLYTIMSVPYQPDPGKPGPPWACLLSFRRCPSGSLTWAHPRPEWGCSKACGAQHSLLSKVTYIRFVVRGDIADLEQLFANLLLVR